MIVFTRFNHNLVALNPDLIERVEANPDTVITMTDDHRVLVLEPFDEVVRLITDYRAYVIKRSREMEIVEGPRPSLHLVPEELMASSPEVLERIGSGDEVETPGHDAGSTPSLPDRQRGRTTPRSTTR